MIDEWTLRTVPGLDNLKRAAGTPGRSRQWTGTMSHLIACKGETKTLQPKIGLTSSIQRVYQYSDRLPTSNHAFVVRSDTAKR